MQSEEKDLRFYAQKLLFKAIIHYILCLGTEINTVKALNWEKIEILISYGLSLN